MAFLLALSVAAMALMAQPGQLVSTARTSPAEAFWRSVLPDAPMPNAILELLRPETDAANGVAEANDDDPPPPMNFNYDDYRALPRSEATSAPSPNVLDRAVVRDAANGDGAAAAASPTLFFLEDEVHAGQSLPFHSIEPASGEASAGPPPMRLYTVRSVSAVEGSSFVVCRGEASPGAVYGCRATGPARAYVLTLAGERDAAMTAAAVCHTDTSRWDPQHASFRLLGVKPGGAAAVCHAVPNALVLSVPPKNGKSPSAK